MICVDHSYAHLQRVTSVQLECYWKKELMGNIIWSLHTLRIPMNKVYTLHVFIIHVLSSSEKGWHFSCLGLPGMPKVVYSVDKAAVHVCAVKPKVEIRYTAF